jgi:hypothetical protein
MLFMRDQSIKVINLLELAKITAENSINNKLMLFKTHLFTSAQYEVYTCKDRQFPSTTSRPN